jgi:hypothetical protein
MSKRALLHHSSLVNKKLINHPHIWELLTKTTTKPIYGGEKDYEFFTANICIGIYSGWVVGKVGRNAEDERGDCFGKDRLAMTDYGG